MPDSNRTGLTEAQLRDFVEDGFVRLPAAFPRSVAQECTAALWRMSGLDPADPDSWTRPVVRIEGSAEEPFRQAANAPMLLSAFDQLVGEGRWVPRGGLGTFPLRFPHSEDAGDAGWHMDAGYAREGDAWPWLNLRSRGRALLMLFLFTDVGPEDAPTRIKVGSHLDVPPFLEPGGERGRNMLELCQEMDAAGRLDAADRATAYASGRAGDVYLCHPFLIHGAQPHHGSAPRFIAQPPLEPVGELELERADGAYTPVEAAVRLGLGWERSAG